MKHRRRSIDADDIDVVFEKGQRDAAGAAAKLEDFAVGFGGQTLPEGDVAAAERLRVLPVVKRRVLVPALPAFSHTAPASCTTLPPTTVSTDLISLICTS